MTEEKKVAEQPQEEKDLKERIDGFNGELRPLLGKYELGLSAMPQITPDGRTIAQPIIVSVREKKEANVDESEPELDNPEA